jgi:hypothetical protein
LLADFSPLPAKTKNGEKTEENVRWGAQKRTLPHYEK